MPYTPYSTPKNKTKNRFHTFKPQYIFLTLLLLIVIGSWLAAAKNENSDNKTGRAQFNGGAYNLLEVKLPEGTSSQMVSYPGYLCSFNAAYRIPNYSAWELTPNEAQGNLPRNNKFYQDTQVTNCPTTADYRNSGFDRGHMAPAADMKWNQEAMKTCFALTNICPQHKNLNQGAWKHLEDKCRQWVQRDSTLIIICGPVLTDRITQYIGASRVAVPQRFFKVILAPYATPPRAIGFIMPNGQVPGGMQQAATTVDKVEEITGMDFFSQLPDSLENIIESQNNYNQWMKK